MRTNLEMRLSCRRSEHRHDCSASKTSCQRKHVSGSYEEDRKPRKRVRSAEECGSSTVEREVHGGCQKRQRGKDEVVAETGYRRIEEPGYLETSQVWL